MTGLGAWLGFGKNAMTRKEHADTCTSNLAPFNTEMRYLKEGQVRVEKKVDTALKVLYKMNGGSE